MSSSGSPVDGLGMAGQGAIIFAAFCLSMLIIVFVASHVLLGNVPIIKCRKCIGLRLCMKLCGCHKCAQRLKKKLTRLEEDLDSDSDSDSENDAYEKTERGVDELRKQVREDQTVQKGFMESVFG
jgi:hypothetical protein